MCEQTEIDYLDGEVVWVKLGSCWWPGEVVATEKLPPDVLRSFRKPPIACVKFFQEDAYEYVKNINNIYKYNCSRKNEFINKGMYLFRTKHGLMEKFPDDVVRAETAVGGDADILTRDEFQETKKESYAGLFGNPKKTPVSLKKGKSGKGRLLSESPNTSTPQRQMREKADYKVHILVQGSKPSFETSFAEVTPTPSTSGTDVTAVDKPQDDVTSQAEEEQTNQDTSNTENKPAVVSKSPIPIPSTPLRSVPTISAPSSSGIYACHACSFSTTRLNVLILHNKTHSVSFVPYTPTPPRKKVLIKSPTKSTPNSNKTPKPRKPRKEKTDRAPKKVQAMKRASGEKSLSIETKKPKTDEEIKSSLLADWDDDVDDDSNDESSTMVSAQSPEVPVGAESPAVPTPAELPSAQIPAELSPVPDIKSNSSPSTEKPESSSDSKYEFCEDEDWPEEADFGRKIPRVKNPVRTEDPKNIGMDDDEVAREVAELLNKTAVPELPSVPEPLRIEENFPEPSIVKSPDKSQDKNPDNIVEKMLTETLPTKAIFKTKTFFRSRHSRSQDAIGKYVAEQLNAVERMDISENDINGSEAVSSPEARDSPPIETVKVAKLAPKIQLKRMKAEAQLREKEKLSMDQAFEPLTFGNVGNISEIPGADPIREFPVLEDVNKNQEKVTLQSKPVQDVIYPTREIKPLNENNYQESETAKVEEPCENKDLFIEESCELGKGTLNYETTTQEANLEIEIEPNLDERNCTFEDGASRVQDGSPTYEELVQDHKTNINPEEQNTTEVEKSADDDEELQTPAFEVISEFEKEIPEYKEQSHTSDIVKESTNLEQKPIFEEETLKYEEQMPEGNHDEVPPQSIEEDSETLKTATLNLQSDVQQELSVPNSSEVILEQEEQSSPDVSNKSEPKNQIGLYLNESTASAVDALLSVSRETDRVPRAVTNDLPEDLFEDDKDTYGSETITGISNDFSEKIDKQNSFLAENGVVEQIKTEGIHENSTEIQEQEINLVDAPSVQNEPIVEPDIELETSNRLGHEKNNVEEVVENVPSESDLQVAEALINLPSTAIRSKTPTDHKDSLIIPFSLDHENSQEETVPEPANDQIKDTEIGFQENNVVTVTVEHSSLEQDNLNSRFETEQEKSENLNAAQSLVQMSESIEPKINLVESMETKEVNESNTFETKQNNGIDTNLNLIEQTVSLPNEDNTERTKLPSMLDNSSSKLLKILEEPCKPKLSFNKITPTKQITQTKEKILNFDVAKSVFKSKVPKQKIIIRRNTTSNKTVLNKVTELPGSSADKIILSRSANQGQEGSSVQTFTIQTSPDAPSDANTIIIQQKIRKISKPAVIQPKLQKIKPQTSLVAPVNEVKTTAKTQGDETMFDINSMPIVLSEDLITPESIEKMQVVMSDGNLIGQHQTATKIIKPKPNIIEHDKVVISSAPHKPEVKTLLLNPGPEVTKSATPNILSKSSKLRGAKPMLVFDKATGKQKIIMTKSEPIVKEVKQPQQTIIQQPSQPPKTEKFIILPTQSAATRPARTQKIVIDPQTGKAHMFVAKEAPLAADNKPVSAKLEPGAPGNTVMIITNAQGAQSRIVLTPRHEKILFPNKQPNVQHLKTISHKITPAAPVQKTVVTTIAAAKPPAIAPVKTPARIVPKQNKGAIITSKGQLIVGGRVATTAQNIAPMPELRPVTSKRIITSEPKKILQTVQKTSSEPIIFLQQKSGAVMQLTAAQFEHLQRTGQIVQKAPAQVAEKMVIQKARPTAEPGPSAKRGRRPAAAPPTPAKKVKHEIPIAPAAAAPPALVPVPAPPPPLVPTISVQPAFAPAAPAYSDFENFEEMLPSTAIARPDAPPPAPEPAPAAPAPEPAPTPALAPAPAPATSEPAPAPGLTEQLLAVPGEHFGALAGTFYLCVEENGDYTPIDNRPLVLENNQLVPMEPERPERRDILEAALANSDVFHADDAPPDFRDLNATVSVHCRVSETSTTLHQPIMTPVEVPSAGAAAERPPPDLAAIGVTPGAVPTSLELPITVTDPRIAPRALDPLAPHAGISMPLLTDDDHAAGAGGKSMPILTEGGEPAPDFLPPPPHLTVSDLHSS